jgi:hypothetical protein
MEENEDNEWCFWVLLGLIGACFVVFPWLGLYVP